MYPLATLFFGFLLGIKHSFEADHVIAVSNIVTQQKNPLKSALVGAYWGVGHTATLLVIGLIVLVFKISIPENVGMFLEFAVGVMIVVLGLLTLKRLREIGETEEAYVEAHERQKNHVHHRSLLVGSVHGLAGSGALMLLVLSTVSSVTEGTYYIVLFGVGSILGMTLMSLLIGLPFAVSAKKFPKAEKYLRLAAGLTSILFGIYYMYQVGIADGLFR